VNVTVENLAPCKKLVRVEVDVKDVDATFETITKDFQRQVSLPGFRPGKAPRDMVIRKYETDIKAEVKRKLIGDSYRQALTDQKLQVVSAPDVEEIQFGRGQSLQFAVTVETAPEFELPEYKGIPVKREDRTVSDEDVERAIDMLRGQQAKFDTVSRVVQNEDVAVVNYTGTSEGKPLTEIAPTAKGLTEKQNFWVEIKPDSFIPGFAEQLVGAKAGEKRTVTVDFPADFVSKELSGKKGIYEVEIVEVKERTLPALDDAFAKGYGAENVEALRAGVRRDLENELKHKLERDVRTQIIRSLLDRVNFDLPESAVAAETRNVVYDLVRENQKRGISRDIIEKDKDAIYTAAARSAQEKVKVAFLLNKIAQKEEVKVSQEEVVRRVQTMAAMYQIPTEKFIKDLQKRDGVGEIYDQLTNEKVLELLQSNAKVETVAPAPAK
jgi:trigger factor